MNNEINIKQRVSWIDMSRGFAMILVIIGHNYVGSIINNVIYSFHMPLFFIICGLTFNKDKIRSTSAKDYFIKISKRLIIPYFWVEFLSLPLWYLTYEVLTPDNSVQNDFIHNLKGIFVSNSNIYRFPSQPSWFLLTMFLSLICYQLVLKLTKGNKIAEFAVVALCVNFSYFTQSDNYYWHLNVVPMCVAFIYIGTYFMKLFKKIHTPELKKGNTAKVLLYFGGAVVLLILGCCSHLINGRISIAANKLGGYIFLTFFTAIALSCVFFAIARVLPDIKPVSYIGRNTLITVGFHKHFILIINCLYPFKDKSDLFKIVLSFVIFICLIPLTALFNKCAPYVAGNPFKGGKLQEISKYFVVAFSALIPCLYICKDFTQNTALIWLITASVTAVFSVLFVKFANKFFPVIFSK